MNLTWNELARIAWTQTWQLTALIVVVAATARCVCRNRPHLAHALWLVVLVKCVTPPIWSSHLGIFCWTQPAAEAPVAELAPPPPSPAPTTPETGTLVEWTPLVAEPSFANVPPASDLAGTGNASVPEPTFEPAELTTAPNPSDAPNTSRTPPGGTGGNGWFAVGIAVWFAGTVLITLTAVLRLVSCLRAAKRAGWRRAPELESVAGDLARRLNLKRAVRVVVTNSRLGPAVVGLFRPLILLPDVVVRGRTTADLKPILMHELVHIRRGDLWVGLLQVIASALWWFHPLVWLTGRMMSREAERCCDEESIAALGGDPSRYAYSLLDVLDLKQTLKPVPAFPGVRPVEVTSKRLERIMSLRHGCHRRTPWWCRLCTAALALAVLPGAALIVSANGEPPKASPAAAAPPGGETQSPETNAASATMVVESYRVGDLLRKLMLKHNLTETAARRIVKHLAMSSCAGPWEKMPGGGKRNDSQEVGTAKWFLTDLVVRQHVAQHRKIKKALAEMRKFGFEDATFKIRIISNPPADLETRWTMSRGEERPAKAAANASRRGGARMSVETTLPVMYEIVDAERRNALLKRIQAHAKSNLLSAPTMTVFNGRTATLADVVQRPFAVGMQDGKPQIRVVTEGLRIQLRPLKQQNGSIRLDYEVDLSAVRDVQQTTLRLAGRRDPVTLQTPTISRFRLESSIIMQPGKTLLIGGLKKTDRKGKSETAWLMIESSKFRLQTAAAFANPANNAGTFPAAPRPRDLVKPARHSASNLDGAETAGIQVKPIRLAPFTPATDRQTAAVGQIRSRGGKVLLGNHNGEQYVAVQLSGKQFTDADLDHLAAIPRIVVLRLVRTSISDDGLAKAVRKLPRLRWLLVGQQELTAKLSVGSTIRDDGAICLLYGTGPRTTRTVLQRITRQPHIRKLALQRTVLTNGAYEALGALKQLEKVAFDLSRAAAGGIESLAKLPKLTVLFHSGPQLTERQLLKLAALKQLRMLKIRGRVSNDALRRLRESLPNCQVEVTPVPAPNRPAYDPAGVPNGSGDKFMPARYRAAPPARRKPATRSELASARRKKNRRGIALPDRDTLIVRNYPVGDLVVPIPGHAGLRPAGARTKALRPAVDMKPLVEFIQSNVAPKTWAAVEGRGSIGAYPKNLSIVIRQTPDVHERIADLLRRLRRLQDVQIVFDVRTIEVPQSGELCRRFEQKLTLNGTRNSSVLLAADDVKDLNHLTNKQSTVKTVQHIKATLFRGQAVEIPSGLTAKGKTPKRSGKLQLAARVSKDRRTIRVQVALDASNALDALATGTTANVPDGRTVLIDVDDLTASDAIPSQPFTQGDIERIVGGKRSSTGKNRFLIITPRIIVREEEEIRNSVRHTPAVSGKPAAKK